MNEKLQIPIFAVAFITVLFFAAGLFTGSTIQSARDREELKRVTTELSDVLIINKELSEKNSEYLGTIEKLQGLSTESTRHIQLLTAGIEELKRNGNEKDRRIAEAENRVRGLAEEVENLGRQIDKDAERLTRLLELFRKQNSGYNNRVNSHSGYDWSYSNTHHYKIAEEYRWQ